MRRTVAAVFAGAALLFSVSACGGSDAPEGEAADETTSESKEAESAGSETEAAGDVGTRENPAPVGAVASLESWDVSLGAATLNANDAIAAENEFNDPPAEGRQFVMVPVTATYTGDESGTAWLDLTVSFVSAAGNTYALADDDYCGVIPDSLSDKGEVYNGASTSGNVCVSVPSAEVEGGTWSVEDTWDMSGAKVFFALQ